MFARSTITNADTNRIDDGISFVEDELMNNMTDIDGCVGLSMLCDRATGRCIVTSAWETEQAMRASGDIVRPLRDQFISIVDGSSPTVNEWDVAIMHRNHQSQAGACARVSWLRADPLDDQRTTDSFRSILPIVENLTGFCSASLLLNREASRGVSTVVYDSAQAMAGTRGQASALRTAVADQAGADVLEVAEFELAVAHLRVPELV